MFRIHGACGRPGALPLQGDPLVDEIPKFDNDTLALELVDNKLDQHSFIYRFYSDQNHVDRNTNLSYKISVRNEAAFTIILTIE